MFKRRFILIFIIVVLLASITTPALAIEPDKSSSMIPQDFHVADCGDFEVRIEGTLYYGETVFYDKDGNFDRFRWHITTDDLYYTVPDTGKEARGSTTFNWTAGIGVDMTVGPTYKLTIPGEGTILINAGHLAWDADGNLVFVKGNYAKEDYAKLCSWFGE